MPPNGSASMRGFNNAYGILTEPKTHSCPLRGTNQSEGNKHQERKLATTGNRLLKMSCHNFDKRRILLCKGVL